jgi:hypothetical protein
MTPSWLALLSPLPAGAPIERKPVASAEQLAAGTAGPIAGWQSVTMNLSAPSVGLRHVLVTIDENGRILSAGDHLMLVSEPTAEGIITYDHHSIGGRYEDDGSFRGTRWTTRMERQADSEDDAGPTSSTPSPPTEDEIAALNRIVSDILSRRVNSTSRKEEMP